MYFIAYGCFPYTCCVHSISLDPPRSVNTRTSCFITAQNFTATQTAPGWFHSNRVSVLEKLETMKHHTLLLTLIVTLSLVDNVCAGRGGRGGGFSFRSSGSRSSRSSYSGGGSRGSRSYYGPPRNNRDGYGVSLGGYYADNYRMRIMFTSVVRHDISRFRVIDLDKIKASKEVKDYAKNGELVSLSSRGYTRVRTSYYNNYGTSSSNYYDDDQDIYFDIYDVDTIHNRTTYSNATLKHIQVRQCIHSLRVSKANAQSLLYACYRWHHSPFVILWIPCVLLFLMWLVVPVLLTILYHQYGKIEDETIENNKRKRKLRLTVLIGFLAGLLLSAIIACFVLTENDLSQEDSQNAILKMQLFRAGITFLCLILFALLSLVTASLKVKLYKFPLCIGQTWWRKREPLLTLVLMVVCFALDLCLLITFIPLKIVHFLLFTSCGFLTQSLQLIMAKIYLKEINLKHFLYYAYLR